MERVKIDWKMEGVKIDWKMERVKIDWKMEGVKIDWKMERVKMWWGGNICTILGVKILNPIFVIRGKNLRGF